MNSEELNLIRQWFNAVQDVTPKYLNQEDYRLYVKICEQLKIKVLKDVIDRCEEL